jgi:hypothetical protein
MKKKLIVTVGITALTLLLGVVLATQMGMTNNNITKETIADYHTFDNIDEMAAKADLILIGELPNDFADAEHVVKYSEDVNPETNEKLISDYYSLREIKVDKFIKGEKKQVILAEPASMIKENGTDKLLIRDDITIAKKGVKYLFFLLKGNDIDGYFISGNIQGKINLEDKSKDEDEKTLDEKNSSLSKIKTDALKKYANEIK